MTEVFQFNNYKDFLHTALRSRGHGSRLKLAEALRCQSAYISQVLNQQAHLSLEQAADAADFFGLNRDEEEFFLTLVQWARAGTQRLKEILQTRIRLARERRALLSNRITGTDTLDEATQARYYSRWYYAAIHVLVTVPAHNEREAISKYLGLPLAVINEAMEFLLEAGLVIKTATGYGSGKTRVFLKGDSPLIIQHHGNWRMRAMEDLNHAKKDSVHFSSVYSLSKRDFVVIKEKLLEHLQEVREIVRPSVEEEVCVLNLDFFSLEQVR